MQRKINIDILSFLHSLGEDNMNREKNKSYMEILKLQQLDSMKLLIFNLMSSRREFTNRDSEISEVGFLKKNLDMREEYSFYVSHSVWKNCFQ